MSIDGTSRPVELLVRIQRGAAITLGAQLEEQLRAGIRGGSLRPRSRLPSTRDLARQLGISRRIVVETYTQLAAEGYLDVRQGARPRIADAGDPRPGSLPDVEVSLRGQLRVGLHDDRRDIPS